MKKLLLILILFTSCQKDELTQDLKGVWTIEQHTTINGEQMPYEIQVLKTVIRFVISTRPNETIQQYYYYIEDNYIVTYIDGDTTYNEYKIKGDLLKFNEINYIREL